MKGSSKAGESNPPEPQVRRGIYLWGRRRLNDLMAPSPRSSSKAPTVKPAACEALEKITRHVIAHCNKWTVLFEAGLPKTHGPFGRSFYGEVGGDVCCKCKDAGATVWILKHRFEDGISKHPADALAKLSEDVIDVLGRNSGDKLVDVVVRTASSFRLPGPK